MEEYTPKHYNTPEGDKTTKNEKKNGTLSLFPDTDSDEEK